MNEFETTISDIDESALDELFDEVPAKTATANNLVGGKKAEEPEDDEEEGEQEPAKGKKKTDKTVVQKVPQHVQGIENIDLDDFPEASEDDDDDDKEAAQAAKVAKEKEDAEKVLADKKEKEEEPASSNEILKSTVEYLIQSGQWQDFEGREDLEITEDVYAKLVVAQDKARVDSMFSELVDSTGPFGKAIIEHVKNGGNPDAIIDIFKEQKSIESISIAEPEGQREIIKSYYSEVLGWKPEKIEKYVANLLLTNELEGEAQEIKELYGKHYEKEVQKINQEQEEALKKEKDREAAFEANIRNALKQRSDLTRSEQQKIEDAALNYDQRLPNGQLVNKFYVQFAKMQANPEKYVNLIQFVMDDEKYEKKIAVKESAKTTADNFKFIKGNGAVSTKKGTSYDSIKKKEQTTSFDWGISPTRK